MRDVVVCVDLGTGSLRTGAVTADGRLVAAAGVALPGAASDPASTVVDPEIWWRALARTLSRTLVQLPRSTRVAGLCIAAVTRSHVLLDRSARPLAAALPFGDRRAADVAALVGRYFRNDNPAEAITAFHPLARLAWFARERSALFERVAAVVEPKDFLNLRLTGVLAADSVTYSRFDALRPTRPVPEWLERCIAFLAVPRVAPWQMLGRIAIGAAPFRRLAGIPVFAGSMDAWASAVGAGAIRAGRGYDIAGTSEVAGLITRDRVAVPGLVSLVWGEKLHQIGGPTQAGADCAAWCHQTFRVAGSLPAAIDRCARMLPNDDRPLFVPYLAGERTPIWRPDVRGAFHGLARGQRADDFMASVLEGVSMAVREILRSAAAATGVALREVRVTGGGARSSAWCQMKADVLGVPVVRTSQPETGLIGAAMAAAMGLDWHGDLASAAEAMCRVERVFEPRAQFDDVYSRRAERYRSASANALAHADAARRAPSAVVRIPARKRGARA